MKEQDGVAVAFREREIALPPGTISREEYLPRGEALAAAEERVEQHQRQTRRGFFWRRLLIVALILLFAGEVWRQAQ